MCDELEKRFSNISLCENCLIKQFSKMTLFHKVSPIRILDSIVYDCALLDICDEESEQSQELYLKITNAVRREIIPLFPLIPIPDLYITSKKFSGGGLFVPKALVYSIDKPEQLPVLLEENASFILLSSDVTNDEQKKVIIAHEIGHILEPHVNEIFYSDVVRSLYAQRKVEAKCDFLSGYILGRAFGHDIKAEETFFDCGDSIDYPSANDRLCIFRSGYEKALTVQDY